MTGLVLAAFRAALAQISEHKDKTGAQQEIQMGCVMLHMELLRDLLSPQVRGRRHAPFLLARARTHTHPSFACPRPSPPHRRVCASHASR